MNSTEREKMRKERKRVKLKKFFNSLLSLKLMLFSLLVVVKIEKNGENKKLKADLFDGERRRRTSQRDKPKNIMIIW